MKGMRPVLIACAGLVVAAGVRAQTLADRVNAVTDGQVRFTYPARPGVCGGGTHSYTEQQRDNADWEPGCEGGPVRVALTRVEGETTSVRWYVGGRWRTRDGPVSDLGAVPARQAALYLIEVFAAHDSQDGRRALTASGLADADQLWPPVVLLARQADRSARFRRAAIEWLANSAARRLGDGDTADDDEPARRQAVFALSQLPRDESVPRLVRIVESNGHPGIRRHALFWLGQTGDDRALRVIEQILRTPSG